MTQPLADGVDRGARVGPRRAGVAGRDQPRRAPLGFARAVVFAFSSAIDAVDLPARLAQPLFELLVQPAAERLLALAQRVLALRAASRLVVFERLALARGEPLLVLERAHVAVDLRQVLGELRFARAQVRARLRDDRRPAARGAPRSRAPGCGPGEP